MGFRFRKSINLGNGVKVNLSKKGIGCSFGTKGVSISRGANGKTTSTFSIPNTGLSYSVNSNGKKKKKYNTNNINTTRKENTEYNMFGKFNLTEKEIELLEFVLNNQDDLEKEFSIHDVSCKGCVISSAYYNKLYDKGLFMKPNRGKYSLNIELLTKLAKEKEEYNEEIKRLAEEETKRKNKVAEKNKKNLAWVCRILFIPMIILGLLISLVEPTFGLGSVIIGIVEFIYSRNYFKKHKEKQGE